MSDDDSNGGSDEAMKENGEEITDEQIAALQAEVTFFERQSQFDITIALYLPVESNPHDYDKRVELIAMLRGAGELDALRAQREAASKIFAMPPKFWMEWIDDEKTCESDKEIIKSLFERAINDFHSPEKMEEAVGLIGLRADCASTVWNIYLDFEKMILRSLEGEEADKYRLLVDGIYARFLRIPHLDIEQTWAEYETFAGGNESEAVRSSYQSALKRTSEIAAFERRLEDDSLSVDDQLNILSEYIEMEMQGGDPSRVQMMFERAIVTTASEPKANLWLQYGSWLDSSLKIPSVAVKVYERAIRHAPCTALWQQYLSALERTQCPADVIDSKWLLAKETIWTADEGLSLYRTYIYLMRRRAATQDGDYSKVLELFEEGAAFLQERFGQHWDSPKAQFRKNFAMFLYTIAKLPDKGRKVWNDILASGSGHLAAAWLEAVNLERFFGRIENARKMLYRAINSASDHPYLLDKALEKVNAQAARVAARPPKKKGEQERSGRPRKENDFREPKGKEEITAAKVDGEQRSPEKERKSPQEKAKRQHDGEATDDQEKKAKVVIDEDGFAVPTMPAVPRKKDDVSVVSSNSTETPSSSTTNGSQDLAKTVFISNLDFKLPKERILEIFPNAKEVRFIQRGMSKLHKGFGYVDFETADEAREALSKDRHLIDGRPMYVSENKPHERGQRNEFRYATNLEKNKLFVSNVHYDATADQVKEVFAMFGAVRDVRIVTHKSGKSKGCAYVEFEEESAASAAIKAEDIVLLGTISIPL
ncbi:unnamed protein product [Toxocara canis]|uniref:Squamous cell carcinoma antigen recognized by T-cells 3 n=1 Tax=Toxocara canis TaxID=6265 RepID=A0A183US20_TOXCA|nr:unnamed protein product [Toxocara canis]